MKVKRLGVSMDLFKYLLETGNVMPAAKVVKGLPSDAVVCGVSLSGAIIWLDIASDTFDEIKEAQEIPMFDVEFETIRSASA